MRKAYIIRHSFRLTNGRPLFIAVQRDNPAAASSASADVGTEGGSDKPRQQATLHSEEEWDTDGMHLHACP